MQDRLQREISELLAASEVVGFSGQHLVDQNDHSVPVGQILKLVELQLMESVNRLIDLQDDSPTCFLCDRTKKNKSPIN